MYTRTRFEFEEWTRVFKLVAQMNKINCSLLDQNPYFFEDQQKSVVSHSSNNENENEELYDAAFDNSNQQKQSS